MKQRSFRNYVIVTTVALLLIAGGILMFFYNVQRTLERNSLEMIRSNVTRQSDHLHSMLDLHYQYLSGIADFMGQSGQLLSEDNMAMLNTVYANAALDRLALIEPDGTAHYSGGEVRDVSRRRYFKEGMQGKKVLSDPVESLVDGKHRVILGVPVYTPDRQLIGLLGGSYDLENIGHLLFGDLFGNKGCSLLVTSNGEIVALDGESDFSYGDNFLSHYDSCVFYQGGSRAALRQSFYLQQEGVYHVGSGTDSGWYLACVPLGINQWMVCYVISVDQMEADYQFINSYEMLLAVWFLLVVLAVILYIVGRNLHARRELLAQARMDGLTGVYNKETAQQLAEELLARRDLPGSCVFLMMDVDHFKEINDTYGHDVGDEVLKRLGGLLRSFFREGDIVGRLGGDEFGVLIQTGASRRQVLSRVEQLVRSVQDIRGGLMQTGITVSVGVAFSEDSGRDFMTLYRSADRALYQTKNDGRNGYSVYQRPQS